MRAIYLDDDAGESHYVRWLSSNQLEVKFMHVTRSLEETANDILVEKPDLLIVDYRLDDTGANSGGFRAGALAQFVRDHAGERVEADIPIVLFSAEQKLESAKHSGAGVRAIFDSLVSKDRPHEGLAAYMAALADGFGKLKDLRSGTRTLLETLAAREDETALLEHDELRGIAKSESTHLAWRTFRELFFLRNGILLDEASVRARLGLEDSGGYQEVLKKLNEAGTNYTGAFSQGWARWWHGRVRNWCETMKRGFSEDSSEARSNTIKEALGIDVPPATSRWLETTDSVFSCACYSCRQPTEIRFSLPVSDNNLYRFLEGRRVCFSCIQSGEYVENEVSVDESQRSIEQQIKAGKVLPRKAGA